jgi:flavin-dependent dehydrogenase
MAGSLLARQLIRRLPDVRIAVFERKSEYSHNVGESMVEIASNYFVRRLGLGSYLYDRHYPKNGLRFFFDSEEKDTPLTEMSEIGTEALPFHPAFQVDRSRLEADLMKMNERDGVEVRRGAKVAALELGSQGSRHRFTVTDRSGIETFDARWVIDATGRNRMIAGLEDLHVPETRLQNSSVWGWFEGVTDIDSLGPESFRQRVRHTPRQLSTIHFNHRGYWIWFIPLQDGTTSIGVLCDRNHFRNEWLEADGFLEFLRGHRGIATLLQNAKPIGIRGLKHLAYGTRRLYSHDRWALVGEAAAFPDPYYSPGADFIAIANDFAADLVTRDLESEKDAERAVRTKLYNDFVHFRFEAAMRLYIDQYSHLGSYELCKLKWDFDVACYYNLWLSSYLQDQHLDKEFLEGQLRQSSFVLTALANFGKLFGKIDRHLTDTGQYRRRNRDEYSTGAGQLDFATQVGLPRTEEDVMRQTEEIFNAIRFRGLELLGRAAPEASEGPKPLAWFIVPRDLSE